MPRFLSMEADTVSTAEANKAKKKTKTIKSIFQVCIPTPALYRPPSDYGVNESAVRAPSLLLDATECRLQRPRQQRNSCFHNEPFPFGTLKKQDEMLDVATTDSRSSTGVVPPRQERLIMETNAQHSFPMKAGSLAADDPMKAPISPIKMLPGLFLPA